MATITNEVLNPAIRSVSDWVLTGTGGSRAHSTADGSENSDSLEVSGGTIDGGARLAKFGVLTPQPNPLGPRVFSFDARRVSGDATWRVGALEFSSADEILVINTNIGTFTVTDTWNTDSTRFSFTYTPVNGSTAYTIFSLRRGASLTGAARFDRILVHQGSTPVAYFDGNSPNAVWTGTPHASTSVLTLPDRRIFPVLKVGSQQRIGPLRAGKA